MALAFSLPVIAIKPLERGSGEVGNCRTVGRPSGRLRPVGGAVVHGALLWPLGVARYAVTPLYNTVRYSAIRYDTIQYSIRGGHGPEYHGEMLRSNKALARVPTGLAGGLNGAWDSLRVLGVGRG